jgi:acyl-CoA reductase-like NAD-dependent aldehyde dehydrogenase
MTSTETSPGTNTETAAETGNSHAGQLYIGGRRVTAESTARIEVTSPLTEQVIGSVPAPTEGEADAAVAAARACFDAGEWRRTSTAAGRSIAAVCGAALRRCTLELGGKSAAVICDDADLDQVLAGLRTASFNYGLAGSVWSADLARGEAIARQVRTGMIGVNGFRPDFSMPFGGIKASGIGREFGREGLETYTEAKALYRPVPA